MINDNTVTSRPITGVMMNYFYVCHTELWYFSHDVEMEHTSDLVHLGRLVHEESYERDAKEILLFDNIRLDRITPDGIIHEVKKSDRAQEAHLWQLKYYLYLLRDEELGELKGVLEFPTQRKRIVVELAPEDITAMEQKLAAVRQIIAMPQPPKAKKIPFCRQCSYRELCWG